jgi:hypothetical protein
MMNVVRPQDMPCLTAGMRDREEGVRLQKLANSMFMHGDIGEDYKAIRKAAEEHLGIWDWQEKVTSWKRVGSCGKALQDLRPRACSEIGEDKRACAHLPAGSSSCRKHACPNN